MCNNYLKSEKQNSFKTFSLRCRRRRRRCRRRCRRRSRCRRRRRRCCRCSRRHRLARQHDDQFDVLRIWEHVNALRSDSDKRRAATAMRSRPHQRRRWDRQLQPLPRRHWGHDSAWATREDDTDAKKELRSSAFSCAVVAQRSSSESGITIGGVGPLERGRVRRL